MNTTTKKRLLLSTLLSGAVIGTAAPAFAQDAEEIIVTGSRIAKKDFTSNSPVATVDAQQFESTFTVNTEGLLNTLPQTVPGFDRTSNNPGNGSATVDLRGLGSNRTLVLVNGTRMVPFGQNGVVDLNTIPTSLLQNVEVLTGGASSVYGADAVAGVVNFIYKDDFEGVETNIGYSATEKGDAGLFNLDATLGANIDGGRGNVAVNVGYANREALFQGEREFSEFALGDNADATGLEPFGSSGVPATSIFSGFDFGGADTAPGIFTPDGEIREFVLSGDVNDFYNYNPVNYIQLPQERYTMTTLGRYEINNHAEVYARASFSSNAVRSQLAPTPIFQTTTFSLDGNPFLTADTQQIISDAIGGDADTDGDGISDTATALLRRRMLEVGPRITDDINQAFQITAGVRGDVSDNWTYDVYFQEGRTLRSQTQLGNVNRGRFTQALLLADADGDGNVDVDANGNPTCADGSANGAGAACSPLNVFGQGNISPEAAAFVNTAVAATSEYSQTVLQGNLSGDLGSFRIAQSPIGVAVGAEYIEVDADFRPSQDLAAGTIAGFNGAPPSGGSFDTYSVYGEAYIPLIEGAGFADLVALELAARVSDVSTTGTNETYRIGGEWAVNDQVRFRASYNTAVRSPNIGELFSPVAEGFPSADDPCSADGAPNAATSAICTATGVPAAAVGSALINTVSGQVRGLFGGNPDLDVEEAKTLTAGVVLRPAFIEGLSLSVDYYDIQIDQAISGISAQETLDLCYTDAALGGVGSDSCNAINRFPDGSIQAINILAVNLAESSVEGIDVAAEYGMGVGDFLGQLNLNYLGTYNLDNTFQSLPTSDPIECAGEFGVTCGEPDPTYRHRVTARLSNNSLSTQFVWRLVGGVDDDAGPGANFVDQLDTAHYFDASTSWDMSDNLKLTVGMNNIFDKKPPIIGGNDEQANTYPATYDVFGRSFFANLKTRF